MKFLKGMKEKAASTAAEASELGKEGWAGAKEVTKEGWAGAKSVTKEGWAGAKAVSKVGWTCCFKKGENRERSLAMGLVPIILTIVVWPLVGTFKAFLWDEDWPYPLTAAMLVHAVFFFAGSLWYLRQTWRRGFKCLCVNKKPKRKKRYVDEEYDPDGIVSAEESEEKQPMTPWTCLLRYFHWGFFPALFLDIFVYSTVVAEPLCRKNPNFCTVLFRSSLFGSTLVFLAVAASPRRGGRLDALMAVLLFIGVSMFLWNGSQGFTISFKEDLQIAICGVLALISFASYPIMLRKASLESGLMKVLYIQSTYGFIGMLLLALAFEGSAPWHAAYQSVGPMSSVNYVLMWKVTVIVLMCDIWLWAMVTAVSFTETIIVAMSLHFALFLGDFGVHGYIGHGYVFDAASIVGIIFLALPAAWLMKRLVTLNCPDTCGKYCAWGYDDEGQGREGSTLLVDVVLPRADDELLDLDDARPEGRVSKYGSTYGSTSDISHVPAGTSGYEVETTLDEGEPKPKKKRRESRSSSRNKK